MMGLLKDNPKLGHISTFAGHPVIAAAGNATVTEILDQNLLAESVRKEQIIRNLLVHNAIKEIRGKGLMLAIIVETPDIAAQIIHQCLKNGLILFFLLFEGRAMRVSPPLNISDQDIEKGCNIILKSINEVIKQ
jgi:4-aminobutyrate aminotransferase-like enzyme